SEHDDEVDGEPGEDVERQLLVVLGSDPVRRAELRQLAALEGGRPTGFRHGRRAYSGSTPSRAARASRLCSMDRSAKASRLCSMDRSAKASRLCSMDRSAKASR